MDDMPDYDIGELLLAAVFIGGAMISFIWAAAGLYHGVLSIFLRGSGMSLVFLGGMANPVKYIIDCVTYPVKLVTEPSGRETPITVVAGFIGLMLSAAGFLAAHLED